MNEGTQRLAVPSIGIGCEPLEMVLIFSFIANNVSYQHSKMLKCYV